MKKYDFDELIDRKGTNCIKYDALKKFFHADGLLPLWVADMDFKTPDFIVEAFRNRLEHEIFGYTFRPQSYYNAIIGWMKRRHGWSINQNWISFSPGVVSALSLAIETFSGPGDGVIVQPPVYFPFFECVKGTGRRMIENPLKLENGRYTFDFGDLQQKIDKETRILLLCNPQNPGGMCWKQEELEKLVEICLGNNILIVSDEIHSDLIMPGKKHIPIASLSEEAALNSLVCVAPSKTFNLAGLSSSVVIIPDKKKFVLFEKALNVGHIGMGNIFGNIALETAYRQGDDWLDQLICYLWDNFLYLERFFSAELPGVKVMRPEATYLVWADFSAYGMNDKELTDFIIKEAGVALNNGARFGTGGDGFVRINIGCPRATLEEALLRLKTGFKNLSVKYTE